jgi:hypothetical protein
MSAFSKILCLSTLAFLATPQTGQSHPLSSLPAQLSTPSQATKVHCYNDCWHEEWRSHYRWGSERVWHNRWRSHYRWSSNDVYRHDRWYSHDRWGSYRRYCCWEYYDPRD